MGADCFELFPELVDQADDILGYSIVDLCVDDADANIDKTQYTQPALYTVNALMYLQRLQEGSESPPDFAAGHSLGEYNALFAAGAFDFATGLKLVQRRGQIMSRVEGGGILPTDQEATVQVGALEQSNVKSTEVLVDMIDAQRLFAMRSKLLSTAKDLDQSGAQLMRLG